MIRGLAERSAGPFSLRTCYRCSTAQGLPRRIKTGQIRDKEKRGEIRKTSTRLAETAQAARSAMTVFVLLPLRVMQTGA